MYCNVESAANRPVPPEGAAGATMFNGGDEILIRFADVQGRLVPDRELGLVRRVEKSRGYFLISIEFTHPLERINFP